MGYWPSNVGCHCGYSPCGCIKRGSICVARGDDTRVFISVYDSKGDEFDLRGASEIVFIVSDGIDLGGGIYPGGTVLIEKRLSLSEIIIAGTEYQFVVDLTHEDTADLPRTNLYFEAQVTSSADLKHTVLAGIFVAQNTQIKDL